MSATLLSPPLVEPVSLAEIKAYLKIEHSHEDDLLRAFLSSARVHLEQLIGHQLISQTWRLVLEPPFETRIVLPLAPLLAITSAALVSPEGDLMMLGGEAFSILQSKGPAILYSHNSLASNPAHRLQLDVEVGFGPSAEDVPQPLHQAIKMITAEWYERRLIAEPAALPNLANALAPFIGPYRSFRL